MIKTKLKILFLLILISFLSLSFIQSNNQPKIIINNLSSLDMIFKLDEENEIQFNYNEYQVMLKLLFQDIDIYPSEIKDIYLKILNNNKEFIDNEYNKFLVFFLNFLKTNKKYKYSEEKFKDKEYVKKRLYLIISNTNIPLFYLQLIDKPTDENELKNYYTIFNSSKLFNDLQIYLFNTLKRFKQINEIQEFFNIYSYSFNKKLNKYMLEEKTRFFLNEMGLNYNKDINIYIQFNNYISTYGFDDLQKQYFFGYEDVNDKVNLGYDFGGKAKIFNSLFKTTSVSIYPCIFTCYGCLEVEDQFDILYFHELTHLFQNQFSGGGYTPFILLRKDTTNISNLLFFFSFFNKELALHEFDANFTSIYVFNKLKKAIAYDTESNLIKNYWLLFKYLLNKYMDFCKVNNIENLFNIQKNKNGNSYDNLDRFLKYYYQIRITESRKISKFISNIEIMENSV